MALPGMRALLPLTLALAACEGGTSLQIVEGRIDRAGFPTLPTELHALAGEEVVGSAPVADDGSFLVAVPGGARLRFVLVNDRGSRVAMLGTGPGPRPLELEVCEPTETAVGLGEIRFNRRGCAAPPSCMEAFDAFDACVDELAENCPHCGPERCRAEASSFDRCRREHEPDCGAGPSAVAELLPEPRVGCVGR